MRCAACLWLIEQVLRRAPGIIRADVNYTTRRAQLAWDPAQTRLAELIASIRAVGYDATPYDPQRQEALYRRERRVALWRLFVAGFGAMQVMMYAFPAYISRGELSGEAAQLMRWASLLITLPVVLFSCQPFFAGALGDLRSRRIGLDTPIALGLAGAFVASSWATFTGTAEVYFDSISMLAFLLLAARYAQLVATRRATAQLDRLLAWAPSAALAPGERVTIAPGERVPADGIVEQGISSADESLLTGEARAVPKHPGDALLAGSVNYEQPLTMRVTRAGADTQAAAIARLAERAASQRPPLVAAADRIARQLTVLVLATALGAALYWGDVWVAVAVLIATCPCALGLAAPIVLTRANAWLLARGALVTRSAAYETLARVTDVVLDKTGTLTSGRMTLARTVLLGTQSERAAITLARSLEAASRHPLSRAYGDGPTLAVQSQRHVAGEGIEATVGERRVRIGTERFCRELAGPPAPCHQSLDDCRVFLAAEQEWIAAFELRDALRPEAAAFIAALRARRLGVHLATGDRLEAGAAIARLLWIERYAGDMAPQDKCDYVARLQRAGRVVAMVGDGLNDTPVLARADVSFAMGAGADAAQLAADVVLPGNRLGAIIDALVGSRRAMQLVRGNFGWALAYNGAALALAAAAFIGPWEAALGMAASSIIVMLNASRTLGVQSPWKASTSSSRFPSYSYS
ncbi:MAG TPA: cation-translocating P-type ATPase [Burkholderiales bacterium]|nr:cation-translocating P-type ATPase [Burkholderiales bacterium]